MTEGDSHIPDYSLVETEETIILAIVAPLSKPKEAAFVLEKNVFIFDSPPYLLKLKLPHPVLDRFCQKAYDYDTKTFKIKLKKDLESVGKDTDKEDEIPSFEAYSKGELATVVAEDKKQFYGFANKYSSMFGKLYGEFSEVINLPNPDTTDIADRRKLREKEENEKWSDDHYLADTMETDHLDSIFFYKPPWILSPLKDFSKDEKEMLGEVINKSKMDDLSEENVKLSEFQIIDILFGYAYNKRTTEGENTVESGWTINKLSSTLSWFEVFEDLKTLMLSCYRRSLIFPLYRNWKLTEKIHDDVVKILVAGSQQVTQSLLEVREIFNESDNRYLLNSLYLDDLSNFAYHMKDQRCLDLAEELKKVNIKKYEVNSELPLLEVGAQLALEEASGGCQEREEARVRDVVERIAGLKLDVRKSESEDSESTESSDEADETS